MDLIFIVVLAIICYVLYHVSNQLTQIGQILLNRDYTNYPVYPRSNLIKQEQEVKEHTAETRILQEHIQHELLPKEKQDIKSFNEFSEEYKNQIKELIHKQIVNEAILKEYHYMVEGNISVLNGKKTIKEVEDGYNLLSINRMFGNIKEQEKRYREWLNTKG